MALADYIAFATAAYALDEASGSALDAVGGLHLTDNNTCGASTGKIAGDRTFSAASSESLSHAADVAFQMGTGDWGLSLWLKLTSTSGSYTIIANEDGSSNRNWQLFFNDGDDLLYFYCFDSGTAHSAIASTFGALSAGTWYLVNIWYDNSDLRAYISVNAGTADQSDIFSNNDTGSAVFRLGARSDAANFLSGELDEVVILKGAYLPSTERTELYNAGAGVAFADWAGASGAIAGTAALTFGAGSSTLTAAGSLAGVAALTFGAGSSTLTAAGALAGSAAIVFGAGSSTLTGSGALAGVSALTFDATLLSTGSIAGTAAMAFGATGTLTGSGTLGGASAAAMAFTATGTLTGSGALAGTAAMTFGAGSSTLAGAGSLAGSAALAFAAPGTLTASGTLAGTAAMTFGASLTVPGVATGWGRAMLGSIFTPGAQLGSIFVSGARLGRIT